MWDEFRNCFGGSHLMRFPHFQAFLRKNAYHGDEKKLFNVIKNKNRDSITQRDVLEFWQRKQQERKKGATTFEGLKILFKMRFITMTRCWIHMLSLSTTNRRGKASSEDSNGNIVWAQFAKCCGDLGFEGSRLQSWDSFGANRSETSWGVLNLSHLGPQEHELLTKFAISLLTRHDTIDEAWWYVLNPKRKTCVGRESFINICTNILSFPTKTAGLLFHLLNIDQSCELVHSAFIYLMRYWEKGNIFDVSKPVKKIRQMLVERSQAPKKSIAASTNY